MAAPLNKNGSIKVDRIEEFDGISKAFDGKQKMAGSLAAQEESNIIFDDFIKKMRMDPLSYMPVIIQVEEDEPELQKPRPITTDDDIKEKVYDLNLSEELQEEMEKWLKELLNELNKLQTTYVANMETHLRSFASQMVTYGHVSEQEAWQNALEIEQAVTQVYEEFQENPELIDVYASASAPPAPSDDSQDPGSSAEVTATLVTSETADPRAVDAGYGRYAPQPEPTSSSQKRELTEEEQAKRMSEALTKRLLEKDKELKAKPENNGKGIFNPKDPDVFNRQVEFAANSFAEKAALTTQQRETIHNHIENNQAMSEQIQSIAARSSSLPTLDFLKKNP